MDVFPRFQEILFIADNVIVVGALKDRRADLLGGENLKGADDIGNLACRGRCPHRPVIDLYKQVDMIRHNHVGFDLGNMLNILFRNESPGGRDDVGVVPYDMTQESAAFFGAQRDEVGAVQTVIVMG